MWDKLLNIKTSGRDDSRSDQYRYPYEPTPYIVLERLAHSGYIGKKNILIDYGCGKGRVDFFLAYETKCRTIGIEYDERMLGRALENQKAAPAAGRTRFVLGNAEDFVVEETADRFYFFNPFSVEIMQRVLGRIGESYCERQRELLLFFYYPSDAYVSYLMCADALCLVDEIDCKDLFEGENPRERIMIFSFGG